MPGTMDFDFTMSRSNQPGRIETSPFVMLVLGDFSGNKGVAIDPDPARLMHAPIRQVDIDNVDELWSLFAPRLEIDIEGSSVELEPRDLDELHPDHLFHHQPLFAKLRKLRKRLLDPASSGEALAEVMGPASEQSIDSLAQSAENLPDEAESSEQMFDRLLGSHEQQDTSAAAARSRLDNLIQKVVEPYIVHGLDPKVETAVDVIDRAISGTMRSILHHPDYQRLESAWRSLFDLVYAMETGETLSLKVCNVSKDELLSGLPSSAESLADSGLYQLLVGRFRRAADDDGFSLLACNYYFGDTADDPALLASLSILAEMQDATVIGAAKSELIGSHSIALQPMTSDWSNNNNPIWHQLRQSPLASRIGLMLPRILGRLPYGKSSDEIDSFDFEEIDTGEHGDFLWSNPVLACAKLLAQSFTERGWAMSPGDHTEISNLPVYSYTENGENKMLPCAEVLLPERSAETILELGIMPIVSYRNQDRAKLLRFQSIANPLTALSGPWSGSR